jgi:hypothetical protein
MYRKIHGIPIVADQSISWEDIIGSVYDIIQTWAWEGRGLGKIECVREGKLIHIRAFETPTTTTIPVVAERGAVSCNRCNG